jgi:hypothetical protein
MISCNQLYISLKIFGYEHQVIEIISMNMDFDGLSLKVYIMLILKIDDYLYNVPKKGLIMKISQWLTLLEWLPLRILVYTIVVITKYNAQSLTWVYTWCDGDLSKGCI